MNLALIGILLAGWIQDKKLEAKPLWLHECTAEQRAELHKLWGDFVTDKEVAKHVAWHEANGPGGTRGPGSGLVFMMFHRDIIRRWAGYLKTHGKTIKVAPIWDPSTPIPAEFLDPDPVKNPRNPNYKPFPIPTWATVEGGTAKDPLYGYTRLGDFKSVDELGRALGASEVGQLSFHARGHVEAGGTMAGLGSIKAAEFGGWHGLMDWLRKSYEDLRTRNRNSPLRLATKNLLSAVSHEGPAAHATERIIAVLPQGGKERVAREVLFTSDGSDPKPIRVYPIDTLKATALHQVEGMGQYIAANLVKDAVKSLFSWNPKYVKESVAQLGQGAFWLSTGLMVGTMHLAEFGLSLLPQKLPVKFASAVGVPMAIGMAAMQALATGKVDVKDIAITTASYVVAGAIVNLPLLIAVGRGPTGWTVKAVSYGIGKLAATLLVGEAIEAWIRSHLGGQPHRHHHAGMIEHVDRIGS